jgi:hypothetical protein
LKYRGFSEAYGDFTREFDLEELAIDPDELFAGARDEIHRPSRSLLYDQSVA